MSYPEGCSDFLTMVKCSGVFKSGICFHMPEWQHPAFPMQPVTAVFLKFDRMAAACLYGAACFVLVHRQEGDLEE